MAVKKAKKPVKKELPVKAVEKPSQQTQQKTSGFAVASLVLGLIFFLPFTSILAIIFGIIALNDIKKKNLDGKGIAIAGIVLGAIFFVIKIFILLVVFFALLSLTAYTATPLTAY